MLILVVAGSLSPVFGFLGGGNASVAHAQSTQTGSTTIPSTVAPLPDSTQTTATGPGGDPSTGAGTENNPGGTAVQADNSKQSTNKGINCGLNPLCAKVQFISMTLGHIPFLLASLGGVVLDYTVWNTLQSATYTTQDVADSFVVKGWKLVRDLSNLVFIFALFVVAFSLIINGDGRGFLGLEPKRTIVRVIIVALFVNFSFFMCRALIDVTNLFGNAFYAKIGDVATENLNYTDPSKATALASGGSSADAAGDVSQFYTSTNLAGIRSISLPILGTVNPQSLIFDSDADSKNFDGGLVALITDPWGQIGAYSAIIIVSILSAAFNIFLLYIFISSAIFLIARTVGLWFLIILSPLAFVSTTIPALQGKEYFGFDDWLRQLTGLAFSAPIYVFFIYLAVIFLKIPVLTVENSGFLVKGITITIKLMLTGAVLIMGKRVASDLAGKLGSMTSNAIQKVGITVAAVGAAAATGGSSAVLAMGRRYAVQKGKDFGMKAGQTILGQERMEALMGGGPGSGKPSRFKAVTNFNRRAIMDVATAGMDTGFVGQAFKSAKQGRLGNRLADRKAAVATAARIKRENEDKQKLKNLGASKKIDKDIKNLKKDKEAGLYSTKTGQEEYNRKMQDLATQKKALTDPNAALQKAVTDTAKEVTAAEKKKKDDGVEKKVSDSGRKIADATTRAAASEGRIEPARQAAALATDARKAAEDALKTRNDEIRIVEGDIASLVGDRTRAAMAQAEAERKLIDILSQREDEASKAAPDPARLASLDTQRATHAADRSSAEGEVARLDGEIITARNRAAVLERDLPILKGALDRTSADEKAKAAAAQRAIDDHDANERAVRTAKAEDDRNRAERDAIETRISDAKKNAATAKENLDRAKKIADIDKSLLARGGLRDEETGKLVNEVTKSDTRNAENNAAVIKELLARKEAVQSLTPEDKLKDIFSGAMDENQLGPTRYGESTKKFWNGS